MENVDITEFKKNSQQFMPVTEAKMYHKEHSLTCVERFIKDDYVLCNRSIVDKTRTELFNEYKQWFELTKSNKTYNYKEMFDISKFGAALRLLKINFLKTNGYNKYRASHAELLNIYVIRNYILDTDEFNVLDGVSDKPKKGEKINYLTGSYGDIKNNKTTDENKTIEEGCDEITILKNKIRKYELLNHDLQTQLDKLKVSNKKPTMKKEQQQEQQPEIIQEQEQQQPEQQQPELTEEVTEKPKKKIIKKKIVKKQPEMIQEEQEEQEEQEQQQEQQPEIIQEQQPQPELTEEVTEKPKKKIIKKKIVKKQPEIIQEQEPQPELTEEVTEKPKKKITKKKVVRSKIVKSEDEKEIKPVEIVDDEQDHNNTINNLLNILDD